MPSRPASRRSPGPGRGTPRSRTTARTGTRRTDGTEPSVRPTGGTVRATTGPDPRRPDSFVTAVRRRSNLTTRALALGVVIMVLVISYASSLRVYVNQREHIATTRVQIQQREASIAGLQSEIARWSNPDYVKAEARQRLGWVVPGETGYKVVGPDGKPIDGGVEIGTESAQPPATPTAWWSKLWGSVQTADHPAPAEKKPLTKVGHR